MLYSGINGLINTLHLFYRIRNI